MQRRRLRVKESEEPARFDYSTVDFFDLVRRFHSDCRLLTADSFGRSDET